MKGKRELHTEREKHTRKASWFGRLSSVQKSLVIAASALALVLLFIVGYRSLFIRPDLSGGFLWGNEENIDYGDGIRPESGGKRKSEDFYTVLILGRDTGGGGNTDTMLLASYDVTNQKATVMSIPRDTMINVSWDIKKINSVYNMKGGGEKGVQALYQEIAQLVGFEPDYRVIVEWEAVGKIVDAIGGVYFDNPYPMDYHDPSQDLVIEQPAGYRLFSGKDAMQVIRWRKNDADSPYGYATGGIGDAGRMELQQAFLKAVIQQMMTPKNVLNIGKISKVFQENVETDLSFQNILWFGKQAFSGGLRVEDVSFLTMPWEGRSVYSRSLSKQFGRDFYLSYVVPLPKQLLQIVNEQLSPFERVFTLADLDIMSVNADGSLSSTTGYVEDQHAAKPPELIGDGTGEAENPDIIVDENGNIIDVNTGEIIEPNPEDPNGDLNTDPENPDATPDFNPEDPTPSEPDAPIDLMPETPLEVEPDVNPTINEGDQPGVIEIPSAPVI